MLWIFLFKFVVEIGKRVRVKLFLMVIFMINWYIVFFILVFGLDCYKCLSIKFWEECDDKKLSKVMCVRNDVICYKVYYFIEDKIF